MTNASSVETSMKKLFHSCMFAGALCVGGIHALTSEIPPVGWTRRQIVLGGPFASVVAASLLMGRHPGWAQEVEPASLVVSPHKAVMVLGANGLTGRECVKTILAQGRPCIATSRSGRYDGLGDLSGQQRRRLVSATVDVSSRESLRSALETPDIKDNLGAIIFAASVSSRGGQDAFSVDRDGVIHAAECCLAYNIPRLVVVSSGSVTRPDSAVYKLLNFVGKGIMEAKIQGEEAVRDSYASPDVLQRNLGYTIIRPGGLTTGDALGAGSIELNQGDNKSGRLSRADVAALCVRALDSADTFDTTFECYETITAKPIDSVGFSNIMKSTDPTTFISGKERRGESYAALFKGLDRDPGHYV